MCSTRYREISFENITWTKRPTKPELHPWFRDNIGLSEFLNRRRLTSVPADRRAPSRTPSSSKTSRVSGVSEKATPARGRRSVKVWPGFTIHFRLSDAIRSVKRQEREHFRPSIRPTKVSRRPEVGARTPKRRRPILRRFVFDFEARRWKQELVTDDKTTITAELVIPETTRPASVGSSTKRTNVERTREGRGRAGEHCRPSTNLSDSLLSADGSGVNCDDEEGGGGGGEEEDGEERFCFLDSMSSTGRETSMSDVSLEYVSLGRSTTPLDGARTVDQSPGGMYSWITSAGRPTTSGVSSPNATDLDGEDPECRRRDERRPGEVPPLAVLAARVWSLVKRRVQNDSISSMFGILRPQSVDSMNKQRYRILDAETKQDIGEMRFISMSGSKIAVRKRRRRTEISPSPRNLEPKAVGSDSDDPDGGKEELPGCRYLYRIVHCPAVTNPQMLMKKSQCKKKVAGIIDLYTGHTDLGTMASPDIVCPYCVLETRQRITRWMNTLDAKSGVHLYSHKDSHYYTRKEKVQPGKHESVRLQTISET